MLFLTSQNECCMDTLCFETQGLMKKLLNDDRHWNMELLFEHPIQVRVYPRFGMMVRRLCLCMSERPSCWFCSFHVLGPAELALKRGCCVSSHLAITAVRSFCAVLPLSTLILSRFWQKIASCLKKRFYSTHRRFSDL
eukprot:6203035-Pleurochrysis_carterae.AAC.1